MTPAQAQRRRATAVARDAASGRIAAEFVIPYPPGIPLLVPGEITDDASLRQIGALRGAGCDMVGPADRALNTVRVLHH